MEINPLKDIAKRYSRIDYEGLLNDPHIELPHDEFKKLKRKELNDNLISIKKVYLDLKYWINIRKNIFGETNKETIYLQIFNLLKQLVKEGKVICPISQIGFFELLKQKYSRAKTAQMVDILSKGIATNKVNDIKKAEIFNLIYNEYKSKINIKNYVWNKAICLFGEPTIEVKSDEQRNSRIANSCYNFLIQLSFQSLVNNKKMFLNDNSIEEFLSQKLNHIISQPEENKSFPTIQKQELLATLYTLVDLVELKSIFKFEDFQIINSNYELINIIPSLKVFSSIHSLYRFEKKRKYKTNDLYDIEHSSIAIGYCDYFFTENSFAYLLKSKLLNFENDFNVRIESDPIKVYELLQQIK